MFTGHYSAAFAAKAAWPRTPLWALVLGVQLVDVAWGLLVIAGIERVRIDPSLPSNPLDLVYMPYTHGLVTGLLWAAAAGAATRAWLGRTGPALAVGAAVASHWLLDLLVHRPDLPLWGDGHKVGLALWNHPAPALAVELGLLLGGAALLWRSRALPDARRRAFALFVAGLVASEAIFRLGPPPPGAAAMAATAVAFFAVATWWARRVERPQAGAESL